MTDSMLVSAVSRSQLVSAASPSGYCLWKVESNTELSPSEADGSLETRNNHDFILSRNPGINIEQHRFQNIRYQFILPTPKL